MYKRYVRQSREEIAEKVGGSFLKKRSLKYPPGAVFITHSETNT
jgi:hypothetical protein